MNPATIPNTGFFTMKELISSDMAHRRNDSENDDLSLALIKSAEICWNMANRIICEILEIKNADAIGMSDSFNANNFAIQLSLKGILKYPLNENDRSIHRVSEHKIKFLHTVMMSIDLVTCQSMKFATVSYGSFFIAFANPMTIVNNKIINDSWQEIFYSLYLEKSIRECLNISTIELVRYINEQNMKLRGAIKLNKYDL